MNKTEKGFNPSEFVVDMEPYISEVCVELAELNTRILLYFSSMTQKPGGGMQ